MGGGGQHEHCVRHGETLNEQWTPTYCSATAMLLMYAVLEGGLWFERHHRRRVRQLYPFHCTVHTIHTMVQVNSLPNKSKPVLSSCVVVVCFRGFISLSSSEYLYPSRKLLQSTTLALLRSIFRWGRAPPTSLHETRLTRGPPVLEPT
jgi:hypothetical protein